MHGRLPWWWAPWHCVPCLAIGLLVSLWVLAPSRAIFEQRSLPGIVEQGGPGAGRVLPFDSFWRQDWGARKLYVGQHICWNNTIRRRFCHWQPYAHWSVLLQSWASRVSRAKGQVGGVTTAVATTRRMPSSVLRAAAAGKNRPRAPRSPTPLHTAVRHGVLGHRLPHGRSSGQFRHRLPGRPRGAGETTAAPDSGTKMWTSRRHFLR